MHKFSLDLILSKNWPLKDKVDSELLHEFNFFSNSYTPVAIYLIPDLSEHFGWKVDELIAEFAFTNEKSRYFL